MAEHEGLQAFAAKFNPAAGRVIAERALAARFAVAVALPARTIGRTSWLRPQEERRDAARRRADDHAADRDAQGPVDAAGDAARRTWKLAGPHFLGHIVHHAVLDPRDGKTLLAAARTGHLGPTIFRSTDRGRTWKEAATPPAFERGQRPHRRPHVLADAGPPDASPASGTPARRRRDCSAPTTAASTWSGVAGFNAHPQRKAWCGGDQDGTPDGPKLHSILIDPRDPKHMYIGMSSGGVFESTDGGARLAAAQPGRARRFPARPERRVRPRSALRAPASAAIPIGSISRTTAASTGSIGPPSAGPTSARRCRSPSARSASRWCCIRAIPTRSGCSRWTAPTSGRASRPAASRRPTARSTAARPGSGRRPACPKAQAWWTVKRQAMTADAGADSGRLLRHDERRSLGQPRRGPELEMPRAAPAAHLRGRGRLSRAAAKTGCMRPHPHAAALVHARRGDGRRRAAQRGGDAGRRARRSRRPLSRASAFASSTSRTRSGRTSRSSSTASSRAISRRRSLGPRRAHDRRRALRRLIGAAVAAARRCAAAFHCGAVRQNRYNRTVCFARTRPQPALSRARVTPPLHDPADPHRPQVAGRSPRRRSRSSPASWAGWARRRCRRCWAVLVNLVAGVAFAVMLGLVARVTAGPPEPRGRSSRCSGPRPARSS